MQQSRGFLTARAALWKKKPDARRPLASFPDAGTTNRQSQDFGDMAELVDATDLLKTIQL